MNHSIPPAAIRKGQFPSLLLSLFFIASLSSCFSSKNPNARFDKAIAKLEKRSIKEGRSVEVDDVYYSTKDARSDYVTASTQISEIEAERYGLTTAKVSKAVRRKASSVLNTARSYLGTPHRLGGMSHQGIDCSGLMIQSFKSVNINLPRSSVDQSKFGKRINLKQVREGDLVFFSPSRKKVSHVGVVSYVRGNDIRFIHTSTSKGVKEDSILSDYWRKSFTRAQRVL